MNIRLIAIVPGLIALSNGIAQVTVDWNQPTRGLSIALDQTNNVYTVDYEYALGGDISRWTPPMVREALLKRFT